LQLHRPAPELQRAEGEARPQHLLEKTLEDGRHSAEPQRIEDDHMLCPVECRLALAHCFDGVALLVVHLSAEQRKVDVGNADGEDFVSACRGPLAIGPGQSMSEARCVGIRMPVEDQDAARHSSS
jgi:hypothetical protein